MKAPSCGCCVLFIFFKSSSHKHTSQRCGLHLTCMHPVCFCVSVFVRAFLSQAISPGLALNYLPSMPWCRSAPLPLMGCEKGQAQINTQNMSVPIQTHVNTYCHTHTNTRCVVNQCNQPLQCLEPSVFRSRQFMMMPFAATQEGNMLTQTHNRLKTSTKKTEIVFK